VVDITPITNKCWFHGRYLIAFGKPAGLGEVAPREFDVPGTMYEPLA